MYHFPQNEYITYTNQYHVLWHIKTDVSISLLTCLVSSWESLRSAWRILRGWLLYSSNR